MAGNASADVDAHSPQLPSISLTVGPRWNVETRAFLISCASQGLHRQTSAPLALTTPSQVRGWFARGRKQIAQFELRGEDWLRWEHEGRDPDTEPELTELGEFGQFVVHMERAEAAGKAELEGVIIWAATKQKDDVRTAVGAAQWLLERKYPKQFGRAALRTDIKVDVLQTTDAIGELKRRVSIVLSKHEDAPETPTIPGGEVLAGITEQTRRTVDEAKDPALHARKRHERLSRRDEKEANRNEKKTPGREQAAGNANRYSATATHKDSGSRIREPTTEQREMFQRAVALAREQDNEQ